VSPRERPPASTPEPVPEPDLEPTLVSASEPIYPLHAVQYDPHGNVRLRAGVDTHGKVESVTVVELPGGMR
jgi:hypothetical protein